MTPAIRYAADRVPAPLRRAFRLAALLRATRSWLLVPAALGLPVPGRIDLRLDGVRYRLLTRPVAELRIDLGILWEVALAQVYPLPAGDDDLAIVDIGAHRGHFTLWAAARRPHAELHAYEPDEGNAARLAVTLRDSVGRCTLHREAVAAEDGTRSFSAPGRSDSGSLAPQGRSVAAVGMRTVLARCAPPRVFVKMDAEGAEHEAFAALVAHGPDAARRIVAVALEWHPPRAGEVDVRRSLGALGFEVAFRELGIGNGIVHARRPGDPG